MEQGLESFIWRSLTYTHQPCQVILLSDKIGISNDHSFSALLASFNSAAPKLPGV